MVRIPNLGARRPGHTRRSLSRDGLDYRPVWFRFWLDDLVSSHSFSSAGMIVVVLFQVLPMFDELSAIRIGRLLTQKTLCTYGSTERILPSSQTNMIRNLAIILRRSSLLAASRDQQNQNRTKSKPIQD
jgi:hypothetical protein